MESSPSPGVSPPGFGPRDLLFAVVVSLSKIRGAQSYLFPTLLGRSQHLLDYADPLAYITTPWTQEPDPGSNDEELDVGLTTQAGDVLGTMLWAPEFGLGPADFVDAWVDPAVEELPM